jgi:hypothetical protein
MTRGPLRFRYTWSTVFRFIFQVLSHVYILLVRTTVTSCIRKVKKGKAIPVTGREGPYGCETSRLPHFLDNRLTDGGKVVSLTRPPPFTPQGRFLILISVRR